MIEQNSLEIWIHQMKTSKKKSVHMLASEKKCL